MKKKNLKNKLSLKINDLAVLSDKENSTIKGGVNTLPLTHVCTMLVATCIKHTIAPSACIVCGA